jgi:hypothetical protein
MPAMILFAAILIFFIAAVIHACRTKPLGITVNFFLFSFLWAFNQESAIRRGSILSNLPLPQLSSFLYAFFSSLGWVLIFYTGWLAADKVIQRRSVLGGNLFFRVMSLAAFSAVVFSGFEVAAGLFIDRAYWAKYNMPPLFFLAGRPTYILNPGFYTSLYFFLSFFLINCSRYKDRPWKAVFFLIPFLPDFVVQFFGIGQGRLAERSLILLLIVIFSITNPLRFTCGGMNAGQPLRK